MNGFKKTVKISQNLTQIIIPDTRLTDVKVSPFYHLFTLSVFLNTLQLFHTLGRVSHPGLASVDAIKIVLALAQGHEAIYT